jgi:hypothetical protein
LEIGSHIGGVLIAQIAVFLHRFVDDPFQFGRNITIETNRGGGSESRMALKMTPELSP